MRKKVSAFVVDSKGKRRRFLGDMVPWTMEYGQRPPKRLTIYDLRGRSVTRDFTWSDCVSLASALLHVEPMPGGKIRFSR